MRCKAQARNPSNGITCVTGDARSPKIVMVEPLD